MKFGICIPTNLGIENFRALMSIGPKAEELGFDSVWVSEHLFNVGYIGERIGGRPYYEPLTVLSYLAAMTSRIRLGTSVLVLPYHDPVRLAKVVATLDVASGGRVVLGLGVGRIEEEYDALGISFKERGAIADEAIEVMKILWTQEDPAFSGRYHSFSKVKFSPKPAQKPVSHEAGSPSGRRLAPDGPLSQRCPPRAGIRASDGGPGGTRPISDSRDPPHCLGPQRHLQ